MSRDMSLEDLNILNNQINSKINELSLKVNETSMGLKHVQENSNRLDAQKEQISSLLTKVALMKKDMEILKESTEDGKENVLHQIRDELAVISTLTEKYQELQGQVNQLRLIVERRENEIRERRTRVIVYLIYPIVVGVALIYIGHMTAKSIDCHLLQQPQTTQVAPPTGN